MGYISQADLDHSQPGKIGVLLVNVGTPAAPTAKAVRPWLRQFLSDPRVVEIPRLAWWFILNFIVLLTRPARSARAYQKIWTEDGSPLLVHTRQQAAVLRQKLSESHGGRVLVDYGFSYGEPSIETAMQSLLDGGARQLLVLPLYPQYSASTGASVFDAVAADLVRRRWLPDLNMVSHYHDQPGYIRALADSVRRFQAEQGQPEVLVMSFHGAPRFQLERGDPYYHQCLETARLLAQQLGLAEQQYRVCFQSRFGAAKWLEPYTDSLLTELAQAGTKSVQVICPGFSVDCLETLEEIAIRGAEQFLQGGGEHYQYIPCLNADAQHIDFMAKLVNQHIHGWLQRNDAPATF